MRFSLSLSLSLSLINMFTGNPFITQKFSWKYHVVSKERCALRILLYGKRRWSCRKSTSSPISLDVSININVQNVWKINVTIITARLYTVSGSVEICSKKLQQIMYWHVGRLLRSSWPKSTHTASLYCHICLAPPSKNGNQGGIVAWQMPTQWRRSLTEMSTPY